VFNAAGEATMASTRQLCLAGVALSALVAGTLAAQAGGFAIREQSAYFQGSSFAGAAAGGPSISSMFWNPSVMTQAGLGITSESNFSAIILHTDITPTTATHPVFGSLIGLGASGDIGRDAIVPAGYYVWKPSDRLALGLAVNSPFGLVTHPSQSNWAGVFYSRESKVLSFNATPQVAYQVTDWLSVGAGVQIQYLKVTLDQGFPGSGVLPPAGFFPDSLALKGDSVDVGFTLGVTLQPTPWTTIGLGYRSQIDHDLDGTIRRPAAPAIGLPAAAVVDFSATVPLPDSISLGIRQKITDTFTLLGTVEWTHWSRLNHVPVNATQVGGIPTDLPFEWDDGWFFSAGFEYMWSPQLMLRAGIAWEESPVTDRVRATRLPDNDRLWLSAGATYNYSSRLAVEFGYSHIFVRDAPINLSAGSGNPTFNPALGTFIGNAEGSVDIFTLGIRYRWGADPVLITKG
jgi:long-chain fatty acid transport protein